MSTTNHTTNYELSQYIGSDVTSYLSNYNSDMYKIDAQMKVNATAAANAQSDASAAVSAATTAASSASAAVSTANAANTAAEAAQTAATAAQTAAGAAQTDAAAALRASASNTIGNLAPAYDATLTYAVGDLVTYVDPETNQGKLYKCIIAIAVPEEFNINKWDDVTTSEVYGRERLIATFNGAVDKTWDTLLNEIYAVLNPIFNPTRRYYLQRENGTQFSLGGVTSKFYTFATNFVDQGAIRNYGYGVAETFSKFFYYSVDPDTSVVTAGGDSQGTTEDVILKLYEQS